MVPSPIKKHKFRKVLILGSGALKIGEAGEFDYSGSQAIKALKEEGIKTVLVNPNIATIQTSKELADVIYFLPVTPYFVEKVIAKEKPDSILLSFGGQTALNCGVELHKKGVLRKYRVRVLGTPVQSIINTEDRELFVKQLDKIGLKTPKSIAVTSVEESLKAADRIGYPVIIRSAYSLGGQGSGICQNDEQLRNAAKMAFTAVPQILVEEYLVNWKEVEYEVVRDCKDNCITVCNMENFDPLGIHTGESIVVAPSQTLSNSEYHTLREISIKAIRHIGIIGECNIQFALDPKSEDYRIIEVNARLSRSSALASKATGYPLAFVAAKLALGYDLTEVQNSVTKTTIACFEPALDYIVVKIPRWDLQKFRQVSKKIGTGMKSVGEVMAIGRKFEEALQKALRMLSIGVEGMVANPDYFTDFDALREELKFPTDRRIFAVAEALHQGMDIGEIYKLSGIDPWFLHKIQNIISLRKEIVDAKEDILDDKELLLQAKQYGYSDRQIAFLTGSTELDVRKHRKQQGIIPKVKQIDTLAAEYPAQTNYLYLTYNGSEDDITFNKAKAKKTVFVLGGGPYRIGSSVEFDWCCVSTVFSLAKQGYLTGMINCNPETVSTDYDVCDKLYFEDLNFETVMDIYEKENPRGIIVSMGGQIPNNLALKLHEQKVRILGTSPNSIDQCEDRNKFSALLDTLGVDQPLWNELSSLTKAIQFADKVGYPVLVRPSYVLSGAAMSVAYDEKELESYLVKATELSKEYPVVISKFITGAKEIEIDAVAFNGELVVYAISEHVENAGVHSGDATMVLPPQKVYLETTRKIVKTTRGIAKTLKITGPFNIQYIAKDNEIKVIECNLRASRSFPFVSKVTKVNFIDVAAKAIMGRKENVVFKMLSLDYVGVKASQFSFSRLKGADPVLSVEMASTGEVATLGDDFNEAFLKSFLATGYNIPQKAILVSIGGEDNRYKLLPQLLKLKEMGYMLYATEHTQQFLHKHDIQSMEAYKVHEIKDHERNIHNLLTDQKVDLVININKEQTEKSLRDSSIIRRTAVDFSIPLITNIQLTEAFINAIASRKMDDLEVKAWDEYKG